MHMRKLNEKEIEFLLKSYGETLNDECGPWNLSLESKWLEYEITRFFEENFNIINAESICNIGIGAGYWDRYLSYKMSKGCKLISVDKDEECCRQLELGIINENNPNLITIVCNDIMKFNNSIHFDIVTMIGSTRLESGLYNEIINKALNLLSMNGCLYYCSLDKNEDIDNLISLLDKGKYKLITYEILEKYGIKILMTLIGNK